MDTLTDNLAVGLARLLPPETLLRILVGVVIVFLLSVLRQLLQYTTLLALLRSFFRRKLTAIETYLNGKWRSPKVTRVMWNLRDAHYFKRAVGIYAESGFREALIRFHARHQPAVTWAMIVQARGHLEHKDNAIHVRLSGTDRFFHFFFHQLVGFFIWLIFVLVVIKIFLGKPTGWDLALLVLLAMAFLVSIIVFARLDLPYQTAKQLHSLSKSPRRKQTWFEKILRRAINRAD